MVRTITLNDGKKIPAMAWGNGTGGLAHSGKKAVDMGAVALKAGILHIDTAQVYGTESETGGAIKAAGIAREKVWVTTKISESSDTKTTPEDMRRSVTESLDKLGFIPDLILLHNPYLSEDIGKFYNLVEDLVLDGTLKGCSLGLSNFRPQDVEAIVKVARIKPVCNQLEYHPYLLAHLDPVVKMHEQHGIVIESYGPLTPILRHPTGGPLKPILARIADRLSKSTGKNVDSASILLLWTIAKGVVAVTASTNPENIKKIAAADGLPDLTKEDMDEIESAGRKVHFRHYGNHMTKDYPDPKLPADV